jgi:tetratricopeptide (TPR) repeat protein
MILIEMKQLTQGIGNLEMALTMAPSDVEIIMVLADAYMTTKRPTQAVELLEKAKAIKKDDVKLRLQLYSLDKETTQPKKAENEIQEVITLTKDNKYRLMYANDLIEAKRFDDAAKILKDIITVDPENVDCLMLLGQVQRAQKKFGEAIETYKTVLFIKGPYAPAHYERGEVYLDENDLVNAKSFFDKAVAADPNYGLGYLGLARVAKADGKTADYTKYIGKAKTLDPNNKQIQAEVGGAAK